MPEPRVAQATDSLPRERRMKLIAERDGGRCVWCGRPLVAGRPPPVSIDHVVPRLKGGSAWLENEVLACRACNRRRGHRAPTLFLGDCEARGLSPDRAAIRRSVAALAQAIERRGGQRRARAYVARELRRL